MNTTCVAGSSQPRAIIHERMRPTTQLNATPMARPPQATNRKVTLALANEKTPVIAAANANLNVTRPVASFINASPCNICIKGAGKRFCAMAETATASVGDRTAASAKATGKGMVGSNQ